MTDAIEIRRTTLPEVSFGFECHRRFCALTCGTHVVHSVLLANYQDRFPLRGRSRRRQACRASWAWYPPSRRSSLLVLLVRAAKSSLAPLLYHPLERPKASWSTIY